MRIPRGRRPHRCPAGPARRHQHLLAALLYFGIMCLLQVAILYMAGPSADSVSL